MKWGGLAAAYGSVFRRPSREKLIRSIQSRFAARAPAAATVASPSPDRAPSAAAVSGDNSSSAERRALPTLSVRSGLDLYLSAQQPAFPRGSVVLMSAINIPDMSTVLRAHGLVPVPVDVDLDKLTPRVDAMETVMRVATDAGHTVVAFLVAHVFGRRSDIGYVVAFARKHGLHVIEDCAEVFSGFHYTGHPQADLVLFSFGTIKTASALGGGVACVRRRDTFERMDALQRRWPTQSRLTYLKKCCKSTATMAVLNVPAVTWALVSTGQLLQLEYAELVIRMLRGFPGDLMPGLRHQPSTPLLYMLDRQLACFDEKEYAQNTARGDQMSSLLPDASTLVPGGEADVRAYWLFPVLVADPKKAIMLLRAEGVDAYLGATQVTDVPVPYEVEAALRQAAAPANSASASASDSGSPSSAIPVCARFLMNHVIYLPVHKLVPAAIIQKIGQAVRRALKDQPLPTLPVECQLPSKL